jgi:hypothetical protein
MKLFLNVLLFIIYLILIFLALNNIFLDRKEHYNNYQYEIIPLKQILKINKNRVDIKIRLLAIEEYFKKNDIGYNFYKKMQEKRVRKAKITPTMYLNKFKNLIHSIETTGYDLNNPIVCNKDLFLVDGSHRIACCIYFNIPELSIKKVKSKNIVYDLNWFKNNFNIDEFNIIKNVNNRIIFS